MFVQYLTSLAPEGETFLVVKQKPTLPLEFHADGMIKATWPAYYPEKMRGEAAWYGNTACFIKDRFKEGRPSASAANCEHVLVAVFDDVGDPQKAPNICPLPPTWRMETSPGNYQWGYAFTLDAQPTKGAYRAAIRAMAAAGFTDPGAINAVRNFRLPGSINLKPGKENFQARLVEFHPEREYTLEQLIEATGVTVGEDEGDSIVAIQLEDDGGDDVLAWLSETGRLYSLPNREGWAGVECPNASAHSDGNPEARYMPLNRAFCCYHAHCHELSSQSFLDWVAEQGGPRRQHGLRDELLSQVYAGTMAKLPAQSKYASDAARALHDVERKQAARMDRSVWYVRYAYLESEDSYFDLDTRRTVSRGAFNALYRHVHCLSQHGTNRRVEASVAYDENRDDNGGRTLVGVTYAPGAGPLCAREGEAYGNRWRNARPPVVPGGDPSRWIDHVKRLYPNEREHNHIFNVMAYKVQNPGRKVNHALLIGGTQGCGKDTLIAPFLYAIGGISHVNVSKMDNKDINTQWGYHYESEVLVIHELRQADAADRRALENQLKTVIAAPPEYLVVNRKNHHPHEVLNRVQVIAGTNERIAINLSADDRRWFVVWSDARRMPEAEGNAFQEWLHAGGYDACTAWLHARDVSRFNPGAAPPMTDAKRVMMEASLSTGEAYLVQQMQDRLGVFAAGVVGGPWQGLCERIALTAPNNARIYPQAILQAFKQAEWLDLGMLHSRDYPTKKHVFVSPDMAARSKSELRRLAEKSPDQAGAMLKIVKPAE